MRRVVKRRLIINLICIKTGLLIDVRLILRKCVTGKLQRKGFMMHTAMFCPKHLKLYGLFVLLFLSFTCRSQVNPLANALAHNDYWHKHPLTDALSYGCTYIEAHIYLRNPKLIVAHVSPSLKNGVPWSACNFSLYKLASTNKLVMLKNFLLATPARYAQVN
jgi:hypothetical protein